MERRIHQSFDFMRLASNQNDLLPLGPTSTLCLKRVSGFRSGISYEIFLCASFFARLVMLGSLENHSF